MMFFSQHEVDALIAEDVPLHDETVRALAMPNILGEMRINARDVGVMSGMTLLVKMAKTLDCHAEVVVADGEAFSAGDLVVNVQGYSHQLHLLWKQGVCLLEYMAGIASFTEMLLAKAKAVNPHISLAATRKAMPSARKLQQQAVLHGGGMIHRAGLSETVLIFAQHRAFMLEDAGWHSMITRMRSASPEKKIMVEAETAADALLIAQSGADVLQLDKLSPAQLNHLLPQLRAISPTIHISAAGGIRADNIADYAATGVDVLVTSSLYKAPLCDFGVTMKPIAP